MFRKFVSRKYAIVIAAVCSFIMNPSSYAALATTGAVYFNADPGSYVGSGIGAPEVLWTHGVEGILSAQQNYGKGVSATFENGDGWSFDFTAPTYDPVTNTNNGNFLHTGFYNDAQRFPFNSPTLPGLNISGNGAGNNTLSGWFHVLEIVYGSGEDISKFAVDFRQFDESSSNTGPSLYGSLRYNSSIPITPVPEPEAYAMLVLGLGIISIVIQRRRVLR